MSQTIVQVENLNLAYRNLRAVQSASYSVKSGEILAVIGQNGSGKTSTVECVHSDYVFHGISFHSDRTRFKEYKSALLSFLFYYAVPFWRGTAVGAVLYRKKDWT